MTKPRRPVGFQPGNQLSAKANLPRGRFITQRLISMMMEEVDDPNFNPKDKKAVRRRTTRLNFYCETLFGLALGGDMQALKYIGDRIEGTPISTTAFVPAPDPEDLARQAKQAELTRERISSMSDEERTALYFQTLKQVEGSSGPSKPN